MPRMSGMMWGAFPVFDLVLPKYSGHFRAARSKGFQLHSSI